ncbi:hypothetical protein V9K67_12650 [Paraflavisolibacter sp. H34]|uniref:hypothetical protein n=1 Tax=Huijunlia imazamoxiresistens TaxID=3127457 RepID=UPI00301957E5
MKNRNDIRNELKELNSNLPPEVPRTYTVPEGYFDGLADSVLLRIREQQAATGGAEQEAPPLLAGISRNPAFSVPEGYFDGLAASILSKVREPQQQPNEVTEELQALSPLLAGISRQTPYSVPANYFEQSLDGLSSLVQEEQLSPLLQQGARLTPYQAPEGYFEQFPATVLAKVTATGGSGGRLVSMRLGKWMRYAAAAVVTGAIALGGLLLFNKDNKSTADLVSHPQQWIANKLKNVTNQDLEEFIQQADAKTLTGQETASGKAQNDVRRQLSNVPDNELDAFLNQVPSDNEDLSIIN